MEILSPMLSQSPVILKSVCVPCTSGSMDSQDSYYPGSYEGTKGKTKPDGSQAKNVSSGLSPAERGFLGSFSLTSSPMITPLTTNSLITQGAFTGKVDGFFIGMKNDRNQFFL